MSIAWHCACGKSGKVPDEKGGKKGKCPACGSVIQIPLAALAPAPAPEPPPDFDSFEFAEPQPEVPVRRSAQSVPTFIPPTVAARGSSTSTKRAKATASSTSAASAAGAARRRKGRDYLYLLTLLALVPLGISLFRSNDGGGITERLTQTVKKHPEISDKVQQLVESEEATMDQLFNVLPGHRLEGSFLARDSWWHWGFALLSAAAFMGLMTLMFPPGHTARTHLIWTGVFTATAGIIVLIGFQFVANATEGMWVRGRGIIVLLFYIVKFIGYSYRAALDPESGFILSTVGFTLGVGLCEELVKAFPVLFHYQTTQDNRWPWRTACMVGFLSGIGFGVSEGIHYSSNMYNGVTAGDAYLVRFISCVALHAVWSGAAAVFIFRHQAQLQGSENVFGGAVTWVAMVAVPMVLHGLYDTLLKKDHPGWALATAAVSFVWLIYQIEGARRDYPDEELATA